MKRFLILTIPAVLCLFSIPADAYASSTPTSFKDLAAYKLGDEFRLELSFSGKPESTIKYYKKSIQIEISNAIISPAKKNFDISQAGIGTIKVYQYDPQTVRARIFPASTQGDTLENTLASLKKRISFFIKGNKLIAKVSPFEGAAVAATSVKPAATKKAVSRKINSSPKIPLSSRIALSQSAPSAGRLQNAGVNMNKGEKDNKIANLDSYLKNMNREGADANEAGNGMPPLSFGINRTDAGADAGISGTNPIPSISEAIVKVGGALAVVLALVLFVSVGAKKYLSAMEGSLGGKKQVKVLSNHFIGVKKNVTIIEIAGEVLVLGVTNDNINLLARYTDEEKVEEIRFSHRLPDRPNGMFKKFPLLTRMKKGKPKVNPEFAKKVDSYVETMKETTTAKDEKAPDTVQADETSSKDELVSSVTASIAAQLKVMNTATA